MKKSFIASGPGMDFESTVKVKILKILVVWLVTLKTLYALM